VDLASCRNEAAIFPQTSSRTSGVRDLAKNGTDLIWNLGHLRRILREYEIHHNQHRPHRFLDTAAPLKPLPDRSISTSTAYEGTLAPVA
jgi:hypothetical protein